jgi:hypothetical protein
MLLFLTTITSSSTPFSDKVILLLSLSEDIRSAFDCFPATVTYRRLNSASIHAASFHAFTASSARKITARMMRKIQVPAYCPIFMGVHMEEYRGVIVLLKNVMDISDIDMVVMEDIEEPDMSIVVDVEV